MVEINTLKEYIRYILLMILLLPAIALIGKFSIDMKEGNNICDRSRYNIYSNSTNGYTKIMGRCYVTVVTSTYQSTERCGLFSLFCYESTPRTEYVYETKCFKLKNGKRC